MPIRLVISLIFVVACGDDDRSGPSGTDAGTRSASCSPACEAKAASCGAPAAMAGPACATLCARGATDAQVACLSSTSCEALAEVFTRSETVCGIGEGGADAGPVSTSCTIGDPPRCDGNAVLTCETIAGMPATVRVSCGMYEECRAGVCEYVAPECKMLDERECVTDGSVVVPGQCCEGLSCFGETDASGERYTRCCAPEGEACSAHEDCCGYVERFPLLFAHCAGDVCVRGG